MDINEILKDKLTNNNNEEMKFQKFLPIVKEKICFKKNFKILVEDEGGNCIRRLFFEELFKEYLEVGKFNRENYRILMFISAKRDSSSATILLEFNNL